MTTVISLSKSISELEKEISNYSGFVEKVDISECTDYRIANNLELLIYQGRRIMFACCYERYKGEMFITDVYNRDSELVYQFSVSYPRFGC